MLNNDYDLIGNYKGYDPFCDNNNHKNIQKKEIKKITNELSRKNDNFAILGKSEADGYFEDAIDVVSTGIDVKSKEEVQMFCVYGGDYPPMKAPNHLFTFKKRKGLLVIRPKDKKYKNLYTSVTYSHKIFDIVFSIIVGGISILALIIMFLGLFFNCYNILGIFLNR